LNIAQVTIGLDGNRCKKIGKDRNRCRKMGKDTKRWGKIAAVSENAGFHVMFLGFVFCSVLVGGSVYAVIT